MDKLDEGYCLVLSGGGAKGVYHIGVWRALRELGIDVRAFVGASIGAVIAGFLAQGSDEALEEIGHQINVDSILALPEELTENGEVKLDRDSLSAVRELFRSLVDNKGLDTSPLRRILAGRLDEKTIRESGRDLGIVTINVTDLEPREVFMEDMEPGKLVDYLMASAAFPGFEQPVIAGKKYMDGGLHDNIPYAMARKRGYRRIIVSDISGAGRNRKPSIEGRITVYIKNSVDIGGVLDFDRGFLDSFTLLGWLDTMRIFGRLKGYSYFIRPDAEAEAAFASSKAEERQPAPDRPETMRYDRDDLLVRLECAAAILEVERIKEYSYTDLQEAIAAKRKVEDSRIEELLTEGKLGKAGIVMMLREAVANRSFEACPYYYWRLVQEALPHAAGAMFEKALVGFWPELPLGLDWLGH